jgi:hypothetical protein
VSQDDVDRYLAALHAMQTGVAIEQARGSRDGEPKHLRVGINSAKVEIGALAALLIEKGLFTRDEYTAAVADAMETEVAAYEQRIQEQVGHSGVRLR